MSDSRMIPMNDPAPHDPTAASSASVMQNQPVASYWHTLLVVAIMAGVAVMSAKTMALRAGQISGSPLGQYFSTMIWLWLLALLVYLGMRQRHIGLREVIGKPWKSFDEVLLDIAIAGGFWLCSALLLAGLRYVITPGPSPTLETLKDSTRSIASLIPHTKREIIFWIFLSVYAGLCEEFVFRGYLQKQFSALTGNAAAGIILSAAVFSLGHLYQGGLQMALIGAYGAMFGALAFFRKNLRPGMMAHAWQDTLSGLALSFLLQHAGK